jgi:hypothetical protein
MIDAAELKEIITRLQEINILLSQLYAERGAIHGKLFTDPATGPALSQGGEVETPEGWKVLAEKKDPGTVSEYERKNSMKSSTGHVLKIKLVIPKGVKI